MSATLANAPLVELIAEVRWLSGQKVAFPMSDSEGQGPAVVMDVKPLDGFYENFGHQAFALDFAQSERLVPAGVPAFMHQPVYRHKKLKDNVATCLYQIGPGIFSANAVPPYNSWEDFAPVIRDGIEVLIATRPAEDEGNPFMAVSLRYIDLFGPEHMKGLTPAAFIRDALNIRIDAPTALTEHCVTNGDISPFLQFQMPMKDAMAMSFSVGAGSIGERHGVIMDTSISTTVETEASVDAVMRALDTAHHSLDASFRKLIGNLAELMPPEDAK